MGADELDVNLSQILTGHQGNVWDLAWHPEGKYLASCGTDKIVRIWAQKDGLWTNIIGLDDGHTRTVRSIAWSPDGKLLASVGFDSATMIWEYSKEDGFRTIASLEGHENEVKSCAFSPCNRYFATCGRDKTVWIWEIDEENEFECSGVLNNHKQDVKKVAWHPTQNILLSSSYDDTCMLHQFVDGDDWETFETLVGHTSTVWSARFKCTPTYLIKRQITPSINPRDVSEESDDIQELELDESLSADRDVSIDVIASVSADKSLKLWSNDYHFNVISSYSSRRWRCLHTIENLHDRPIYDLDWHPYRDLVATCAGDNSFCLVLLNFAAIEPNFNSLSPDFRGPSKIFMSHQINSDHEASRLHEGLNGMQLIKNEEVNSQLPLTTSKSVKLETQNSQYYTIFKIKEAHSQDINSIKFNPREPNLLATASDDGSIKIWNISIFT